MQLGLVVSGVSVSNSDGNLIVTDGLSSTSNGSSISFASQSLESVVGCDDALALRDGISSEWHRWIYNTLGKPIEWGATSIDDGISSFLGF